MLKLYNFLSKKVEEFRPISKTVGLYTCGPTVYDYTHIGHMRAYVINDLLKRTLDYCGFKVKHVMNITDVGHLSGDDDSGEDKMEKGAKKYGKTVWDVAKFYTEFFFGFELLFQMLPVNNTRNPLVEEVLNEDILLNHKYNS